MMFLEVKGGVDVFLDAPWTADLLASEGSSLDDVLALAASLRTSR